jgi:protease PrsW
MLLGLAGFVGVTYLVERVADLDHPIALAPLTAVLLSALPALLWLGYFYSQDRLEPEPKHYVLGVYLIGAFVAGPVAHFLIDQVTVQRGAMSAGFHALSIDRLVLAFLVVGLAQELSKYAAVPRFTCRPSSTSRWTA